MVVDTPLAHLDRTFDYLVPGGLEDSARPGVRTRVRFAGRLMDAFVVERATTSEHVGRMAFLERVVSTEPILDERMLALVRAVADRWAGTVSDVLRLAVPPRHAGAERLPNQPAPDGAIAVSAQDWLRYSNGEAFVTALAAGRSPRAVWSAAPGPLWPTEIAVAAGATAASGRGVVIVVPDLRHVDLVDTALTDRLGTGRHVVLHAELGPQERYRRWLSLRRGLVPIVVGTRSAAYAPHARLGLVVCWDDGNDLHDEPRAPYPNARDVLLLRAHLEGAGALVGGVAPSVESVGLLSTGWAKPLQLPRATLREAAPRIRTVGDDHDQANDPAARAARIPSVAWRAAKDALDRDQPVLVQVARGGYQPGLTCERCRRSARCAVCAGPLRRKSASSVADCSWCGALATGFRCPECAGTVVRSAGAGSLRTAEELGRAFPNVVVRVSGGGAVLARIPRGRCLIVSTPGAEPMAEGGYGAALLLDATAALGRSDLRAGEEALRRWLAAASLVRPAGDGGQVVVVADGGLAVVKAMVRWDPVGFAQREAAERESLGFPPAVRMASVDGDPEAIRDAVLSMVLPPDAELLGPVAIDGAEEPSERLIVRIDRSKSAELAASLHSYAALRSARKSSGRLRVQLDPRDVL